MIASEHIKSLIALDVGEKRIGVAVAGMVARLPRPLGILQQSPHTLEKLMTLIDEHNAGGIVIGLPRNLDGDDTPQTAYVRDFGRRLETMVDIPVYWVDEALTSRQAEMEYASRKIKPQKGDIDSLAACYILSDFLQTHKDIKI